MDFLNTLFPNDPAFSALVPVQRVKALQQQSLLRAGLGMLGDTTGPMPMSTGPALAKNLGGALQGFPQELQGAAENAARLQAYNQQQNVLKTRRSILAMFPEQPNETPEQVGARLMKALPYFVQSGDMDMVSKLTELLKSMKFGEITNETPHAGMHKVPDPAHPGQFISQPEQYTIGRDQQGNQIVNWTGIPPVTDQNAKDALALQHESIRANGIVSHYDTETKDLATAHLFGRQGLEQADRAVAGDPASQYALFHAFLKLNDPQAVVRPGTAQLAGEAMSMYQKLSRWEQQYFEGKAGLMDPSFTKQVARVVAEQVRDLERRWGDTYNRSIKRLDLAQLSHDWIEPPDTTPEEIIAPWAPKPKPRNAACAHDITKC